MCAPGVVDAVAAARVRLEQAELLLVERLNFEFDHEERLGPAAETEWRTVIEQAIRGLQQAIDALRRALEES
jgi:hypothetical protein